MKKLNTDFFTDALTESFNTAVRFNTVTGEVLFLKSDDKRIKPYTSMNIADYAEYFIRTQNISDDDAFRIRHILDAERFRERCRHHGSGMLVIIRRRSEEKIVWSVWRLAVPAAYSSANPDVLLFQYNLSDYEHDEISYVIKNNAGNTDNTATAEEDEKKLVLKTFGNFEITDSDGNPVKFRRKKSREILAYLADQYGYPVTTSDIVTDVLEKTADNKTSLKYVSALLKYAAEDLKSAGFENIIIREWNSVRINVSKIRCDYYRLIEGDTSVWDTYHNEYMKEFSWAEKTNAELYKRRTSEQ